LGIQFNSTSAKGLSKLIGRLDDAPAPPRR
jgi:hypothetical protein